MSGRALIRIRSLDKSYRESDAMHAVIRGLDLDLAPGEILAVVGRSGSGKTTLLNLVGAMDRPDSGRILFGDDDMGRWDERARTRFRRRHLGFVFQAFNLVPTLTVRENVTLPLELNGLPDDGRVDALLETLGIRAVGARFPDQISGGEQQRAAIGRALVHEPALVIADEPTGNLDRDTGRDVIRLFERCARGAGSALLMATHSLDMLGHADRALELRDGALVEIVV